MSKAADYARERLESFQRGERGPYHGFNRDLRLVLDALKEAERARHVYPSLSCNKCGQPTSITIGGLCSPCHIAEDFQS